MRKICVILRWIIDGLLRFPTGAYGQNHRREDKRRQHELRGADKEQEHDGAHETENRRKVLCAPLPLVDHDGDEERRHQEVNAFEIKWDGRPHHGTEDGTEHPDQLAQQLYPELHRRTVQLRRNHERGEERIGLIRETPHEIRILPAALPEILEETEAVEKLPGIHDQRRQRYRNKRGAHGQKRHHHILKRTAVDKDAGKGCPARAEPRLLQHDAEARRQKKIREKNRQCPLPRISKFTHR